MTSTNPLATRPVTDDRIIKTMAICAGYAYAKIDPANPRVPEAFEAALRRKELDSNCTVVSQYVDAMFIWSTAFLAQSKDGNVIILSYRGTEPTNLTSWLTNIQVQSEQGFTFTGHGLAKYNVHAGFYRNVLATLDGVIEKLRLAVQRKSILDGKKIDQEGSSRKRPVLYITGHSLGGAMAVIMGLILMFEDEYENIRKSLKGVYTFGQPMVGCNDLADAYDKLDHEAKKPILRLVYRNDPVPHLPSYEFGRYQHIGEEIKYINANRGWSPINSQSETKQMKFIINFPLSAAAPLLGQVPFLREIRRLPYMKYPYNFGDHLPRYYIDSLPPSDWNDYEIGKLSYDSDGFPPNDFGLAAEASVDAIEDRSKRVAKSGVQVAENWIHTAARLSPNMMWRVLH